jgi:hypothetical protein
MRRTWCIAACRRAPSASPTARTIARVCIRKRHTRTHRPCAHDRGPYAQPAARTQHPVRNYPTGMQHATCNVQHAHNNTHVRGSKQHTRTALRKEQPPPRLLGQRACIRVQMHVHPCASYGCSGVCACTGACVRGDARGCERRCVRARVCAGACAWVCAQVCARVCAHATDVAGLYPHDERVVRDLVLKREHLHRTGRTGSSAMGRSAMGRSAMADGRSRSMTCLRSS